MRVYEGECMGNSPGDEPLTDEMPELYEDLGWKCLWPNQQLKGQISFFLFFLKPFLFYCSSFHSMMRADLEVARGGND